MGLVAQATGIPVVDVVGAAEGSRLPTPPIGADLHRSKVLGIGGRDGDGRDATGGCPIARADNRDDGRLLGGDAHVDRANRRPNPAAIVEVGGTHADLDVAGETSGGPIVVPGAALVGVAVLHMDIVDLAGIEADRHAIGVGVGPGDTDRTGNRSALVRATDYDRVGRLRCSWGKWNTI